MFRVLKAGQESAAEDGWSGEDLARLGGRTCLLWLTVSEPHAMYGNGVLSRLELPLPVEGPSAMALVSELNQWELIRSIYRHSSVP